MLRQILASVLAQVVSFAFVAWAIVSGLMNWIGRSTVVEDAGQLMKFLISVPWYIPAILAGITVAMTIRQQAFAIKSINEMAYGEKRREEKRIRKIKAKLINDKEYINSLKRRLEEVNRFYSAIVSDSHRLSGKWEKGEI